METDFYDSINYPNGPVFDYDHYIDGKKIEHLTYEEMRDQVPMGDAELTFNSILTYIG